MNTLLMYALIGLGVLLVMLLIPGVKVLAELVLKGLLGLFGEVLRHKGIFGVWFVKTIVSDHARLFRHATTSRDKLDPTQKIRREAAGYED